ncbi:LPS-assembly lipoprotein LptE [Thiohalorhabdus sp.]|uniref:LPS-assembly lipoprotein LptE n=1 Tax=Thiohalorhabdus sp. TaxID=3094134 RepID=UPI002FC2DCD0
MALILVTACGYHFPGSGAFPADIRSIYLDAEPADSPLARALADALRRDDEVRLVSSRSQAEGVLVVTGGGLSSSAAAIDTAGVATEYEVTVRADFRLLKPGREAGEVVSESQGLETSTTFPSEGTTPTAEEANKRRAGRQAAEDLARRILRSVKSSF